MNLGLMSLSFQRNNHMYPNQNSPGRLSRALQTNKSKRKNSCLERCLMKHSVGFVLHTESIVKQDVLVNFMFSHYLEVYFKKYHSVKWY